MRFPYVFGYPVALYTDNNIMHSNSVITSGKGLYILCPYKKKCPYNREAYRYVLHNDVSVNDRPHIRRLSHKIIIL